MNKALKFFVMAVITLSVLGMSQSASAWWGHAYWGGPVWGPRAFAYPAYYGYYGYGYYGGWGYDPCCAPIVEPCCAPATVSAEPCATCEPVCDVCGPTAYVGGYATNYVLGWRPGPIRRLLFGRYRWYATGFVGGYYYTPDCCVPTYDTIEAPANGNATPAPAAPVQEATPAAPSIVKPEGESAFQTNSVFHQASFTQKEGVPSNSGIVTIYVPQDAVVYVNDKLTSTTGSSRSFVSFGLTAGNEYDYVIRAEVTRDGRKYVETKVVTLKAGDQSAVSFSFMEMNAEDRVAAL